MKKAAVIAVGSEMLLGIRTDTNSAEIARALTGHGFEVGVIRILGDDLAPLTEAVRDLAGRFDLVVVGGGLGPTHDDVTRQAVADALGKPLVRSDELVRILQGFPFASEDLSSPFYLQADLVEGAEAFPGVTGTAPAQVVEGPVGDVLLLPGPPSEMRPLLTQYLGRHEESRAATVDITVVGMSESVVMERILDLMEEGIELTLLASTRSVQVVLFDREGNGRIGACAERIVAELGEQVVSPEGRSLPDVVLSLAREQGVTIGTVESCTGGMVAAALTDVAGSSDVFVGGAVTYSNALKAALVGVSKETLAKHGAVSREVAAEMAEGGADALGCDLAVSITGIAGPGGGSTEKPVGTIWFGVRFRGTTYTELVRYHGDREVVRARSATHALDLVRKALLQTL